MTQLTFRKILEKTREVSKKFETVEQRKWGIEAEIIELAKQVGDLSKNVMMLEKYYLADRWKNPHYSKASKEEVGDELSDILYMLVRIADHYNIDLEKAHLKALDKASKSLENKNSKLI